jgi:hypothetical protein
LIKNLLEKNLPHGGQDSKGHSDCWYIQPYSRILISTAKGETFDVPTAMINTKPGRMGVSVNTNYKISINGVQVMMKSQRQKMGRKHSPMKFGF